MKLPELHRIVDEHADWHGVAEDELNDYQRRAIATFGIDTPGNRQTALGVAESLIGLSLLDKDHDVLGTYMLWRGRKRDLKDGKIAHETQTKSPIGAGFDGLADSGLLATALPILDRKNVISKAERTAIEVGFGVRLAAAVIAKNRGNAMHVSAAGKLGALMIWGGIGMRLTGDIVGKHLHQNLGEKLTSAGTTVGSIGATTAFVTGLDYFRRAVR